MIFDRLFDTREDPAQESARALNRLHLAMDYRSDFDMFPALSKEGGCEHGLRGRCVNVTGSSLIMGFRLAHNQLWEHEKADIYFSVKDGNTQQFYMFSARVTKLRIEAGWLIVSAPLPKKLESKQKRRFFRMTLRSTDLVGGALWTLKMPEPAGPAGTPEQGALPGSGPVKLAGAAAQPGRPGQPGQSGQSGQLGQPGQASQASLKPILPDTLTPPNFFARPEMRKPRFAVEDLSACGMRAMVMGPEHRLRTLGEKAGANLLILLALSNWENVDKNPLLWLQGRVARMEQNKKNRVMGIQFTAWGLEKTIALPGQWKDTSPEGEVPLLGRWVSELQRRRHAECSLLR